MAIGGPGGRSACIRQDRSVSGGWLGTRHFCFAMQSATTPCGLPHGVVARRKKVGCRHCRKAIEAQPIPRSDQAKRGGVAAPAKRTRRRDAVTFDQPHPDPATGTPAKNRHLAQGRRSPQADEKDNDKAPGFLHRKARTSAGVAGFEPRNSGCVLGPSPRSCRFRRCLLPAAT